MMSEPSKGETKKGDQAVSRFRMSVLFRFSQLLAWLLAIILLLAALSATLLDPHTYSRVMEERDVYRALQAAVGGLAEKGLEGVPDQDRSKIVSAITETLSPQWIEGQISKNLEEFLKFVGGRSDRLELRIPLAGPKKELAARLEKLVPAGSKKRITDDMQKLPDEWDMASGAVGQTAKGLRGPVRSMSRIPLWTLVGAAVLGLLIWFLTGRKAMAIGWLGDGMLFGGIIAAIFSLILPLPGGVLPKPSGPFEMLPVKEVLADVLGAAGAKARVWALIVSAVGIVLVAADRYLEGRARRKASVAPDADNHPRTPDAENHGPAASA